MERLRGRKPSPAMVVSIIALIFALAGTSIASVATISVLNKREKKQTRNIAKGEIKKAAPGLSVANADQLDALDSTAFARVVADETRNIDPPNTGSGQCLPQTLTGGSFAAVQPGDAALVFPAGDVVLVPTRGLQSTAGQVQFALCNITTVAIDEGATDWRVIVLR